MERKMTMLKLLLLIPAFLFGVLTYAQKVEPVKKGSVNSGVKVDPVVSNVKASSWKLEEDVVTGLENMSGAAQPVLQKPVYTEKATAEYDAKKQAFLDADKANADKLAAELPAQTAASNAKIAASPNNTWDILFNFPIVSANFTYGVDCDGNYLYTTYPYNSSYRFAKWDYQGNLVENFNIPGVDAYGTPNYLYLRDMAYDGQYWWVVQSGSTTNGTSKLLRVDLTSKTLQGSIDLPFSSPYWVAFDAQLDGGQGGFWCGTYSQMYSISLTGALITGPTTMPYGTYGAGIDEYSSPGNRYLWFAKNSSPYGIAQYDIASGTFTTGFHSTSDLTTYAYPYVYALSESKLYEPGKLVLLGSVYSYNIPTGFYYHLFGYELGYTVQYPTDAGVKTVLTPTSGVGLGTNEIVTAVFRNYGTSSISNVPVKFSVDGVDSPIEIVPGTVPPLTDFSYTFTATADLHQSNNWNVCVSTVYPGDQFSLNDKKCKVVVNNNVTLIDTIYPTLLPNNTGTVTSPTGTPPSTITQSSLIKFVASYLYGGWAKFPLVSIPNGATIQDVKLRWYMSAASAPYYRLNKLTSDPTLATPTVLWNEISTGYNYNPTTWTSHASTGWQVDNLGGAQIKTDIASAAANQNISDKWWAVGFYEDESGSWNGTVDGWNETNKPHLIITHESLQPHDVGVVSILNDDFALANSVVTPSARVKNYGTTPETFTVTMTGPAGYTSTVTTPLMQPTDEWIAVFTPSTFPAANSTFTCCVTLATDNNFFNQCKSKPMQFDAVLTRAYGYITNPLTSGFAKGPVKFYLEHPDYLTQINTVTGTDFVCSGTWGKDNAGNEVWYTTDYYAPPTYNGGHLIKFNPVTGDQTIVGNLGVNINGLSYDYSTGKLYGIGSVAGPVGNYATTLYEVNKATGQAILFCNLGYTTGLGVNLACNANGTLYFVDIAVDKLFVIDPLNYDKEAIGATGFDMNYAQDMEFDRATGKLYLAAYGAATGSGALYKGNLSTGIVTKVKGFPAGLEMTGFAIPYTPVVSPTDLGLMMVKFPKTGNLTTAEPVIVKIRNYGTTTVNDCKLSYQLGTAPVVTEQWSNYSLPPLIPGDWLDYSFNNLENLSATGSTFCFKSWVWDVPNDVNWVNDTVGKCVKNTACVLASACYTGGIQEAELCGDDVNGGCAAATPAYVTLTSGASYCGEVWKVDTLRDTDWYTFTISTIKTIKVTAKAEFGMDVSLVQLPCSSNPALMTKIFSKCVEDSLIYANLTPGTYAIVVAPNFGEYDIVCGFSNRYTFKYEQLPPRYCHPTASGYTGNDEYIKNVTFATINNSTGFTMGGYADYTYISTYIQTGDTIPISVLIATYWASDATAVYIDWNSNYLFDAANEKYVLTGGGNLSPGRLFTGNIIVPANVTPGPRTMRVRMAYYSAPDPCTDVYYSEGEDYTVFVIAPVPTIVTTLGSLNEACPGTKIVPINVQDCNNIQSMNLKMTVSPDMTLTNYYNLSSALDPNSFYISQAGTEIIATWFSLTPASVGTGKLVDLEFTCPSGNNSITWDVTPGGSYYANSLMGNLDASWIGSTLVFGNCSNLTGKTWYAKKTTAGVPIPATIGNPGATCSDVTVQLLQNNVVVQTACPNSTGDFGFTDLNNGTYTLRATSTKAWGGVNAADAQAIMRNFVHLNNFYLTGVYLTAGEINGLGQTPNSLDALLVTRRFVGIIPNFMPPAVVPGRPDWASETHTVTINGTANQYKDIYMLCTGDVNGSYTHPTPMKNSVIVNNETSINAENEVIDLPIYAENEMNVGSVSLVLSYPANLQILDVNISKEAENLVYNAKDGQLRMAWFGLDPIQLKAGDVLATLKVKVSNLNGNAGFTTNNESVLTDGEGMTLDNASLIIPKLVNNTQDADYSLSNVPNPFSSTTEIRYTLPKAGNITLKVYNVLGEEISTLIDGQQSAGSHTLNFDGSTLARGVYMYKLTAGDVTKVKTMVITE